MQNFKSFLTEASIRQGLPHITSMDHHQFGSLIKTGKVHTDEATEKTDGMTHVMGHDEHGFYTQSSGSGSERMRKPEDFHARAKRRAEETGKAYDPTASDAFGHIHGMLHRNEALQKHLKTQYKKTKQDVKIRGEAFYKPFAKPGDKKGEIKFVGTSYDPSHMAHHGKYVIHTKLPENHHVDADHFKKHMSTHDMNFDDDRIHQGHHDGEHHVDVSDEHKQFHQLNHALMGERTKPSNKADKEAEHAKLQKIKDSVAKKVDDHFKKKSLTPKWGSGSEGIVVHPTKHNPEAPRFKVTSDAFKKYRAEASAKPRDSFKNRFMKEDFLYEGGNIKIGEHSAEPLDVEEHGRHKVAKDVHDSLVKIHDTFQKEHGGHLFGEHKKALASGAALNGSTRHLFNSKISDEEFVKHKKKVGDIDVMVDKQHHHKIQDHLAAGKKFGKYTSLGTKKNGSEVHALMKHDNGHVHQFDFEGVDYHHDEPHEGAQLGRSSSWEDTKHGITGAHRAILLNAAGRSHYKFATHGLKSRTDESEPEHTTKKAITHKLFGKGADHSKIGSFLGVTDLIKHHVPHAEHQEVYDKVADAAKKNKRLDSGPALAHLRKHLSVKKELHEAVEEHHASVIPLVGFSPISHMGHAKDLGGALRKLPGEKHVGISSKADLFHHDERKHILSKQWGEHKDTKYHISNSGGAVIAHAYHSLPKTGKKHLHILVGSDRQETAEGLKKSLEAGKIKEMEGHKWDSVHIHYPDDKDRTHGMSGTKMREAAANGDHETFHKHLGPMFSKKESGQVMKKIGDAVKNKTLKLKR